MNDCQVRGFKPGQFKNLGLDWACLILHQQLDVIAIQNVDSHLITPVPYDKYEP